MTNAKKEPFRLLVTGKEPTRFGSFVLLTNEANLVPTQRQQTTVKAFPFKTWPPDYNTWLDTVKRVSRPLSEFRPGTKVTVRDRMQDGYSYELTRHPGDMSDLGMTPEFTPAQMLLLGVFEGHYLNDCVLELPREWFIQARVSLVAPNQSLNLYGLKSRSSRAEWKEKGWIAEQDPRGWFQWYCRAWLGRRTDDDARQVKRWRNFAPRNHGQIRAKTAELGAAPGDPNVNPRQRQSLLQWAHAHNV